MSKKLDTDYTENIVCPYCGCMETDSWERFPGDQDGEGDIECQSCGKTFHACRHCSITYSSSKKEAKR